MHVKEEMCHKVIKCTETTLQIVSVELTCLVFYSVYVVSLHQSLFCRQKNVSYPGLFIIVYIRPLLQITKTTAHLCQRQQTEQP